MKPLTVFLSSTCYDLRDARSVIEARLTQAGHQAIRSEHHDVLYDPADHTHANCLSDVAEADVLVLVVGGRWGGELVPDAQLSMDAASKGDDDLRAFLDIHRVSVTQAEVLQAIHARIPIYTLVREDVWQDRNAYIRNSKAGVAEAIYPSIEKAGTEEHIFGFLSFLQRRPRNNVLMTFAEAPAAIELVIHQLSGLFRRVLAERRMNGAGLDLRPTQLSATEQHIERMVRLTSELDGRGIESAFSGSVARSFHGSTTPNHDIDLLLFIASDRAGEVIDLASELGMTMPYEDPLRYADEADQLRLDWDGTSVDVFFHSHEFHNSCRERVVWRELRPGAGARILSAEDSIVLSLLLGDVPTALETAANIGRPLDLAYVETWRDHLGIEYSMPNTSQPFS